MVCVVASGGKPLMPTNEYRARKLLSKGRAEIYKRNPFTIRILDREDGETQPIEYKCDTGYQNIGVSICTEKKELASEERTLLSDEPERRRNRAQYRRQRRGRKRHRKPRFENRKGMMRKDGFAPSIRNRRDAHVNLFLKYREVMPITEATFEMGEFDTQVLKAVEEGKPVPRGLDYQHGPGYGYETQRAAVFARDRHTCQICGKGIRDGAILRVHHVGFWKGDHTDRTGNLLTVCARCHSPRNHKPGGKLWGLKPPRSFREATFMTSVRWDMIRRLKEAAPEVEFHFTYGQATKDMRMILQVKKSHGSDAWAMGRFHPKHRSDTKRWRKARRNDRVLQKFYDATYSDLREDGKDELTRAPSGKTKKPRGKKGAELPCGRTRRCESRRGDANERVFRGHKITKGRVSVRRERRGFRPGDSVWVGKRKYVFKSNQNNGTIANFTDGTRVQTKRISKVVHTGGWRLV